jgi:hypothetical protein
LNFFVLAKKAKYMNFMNSQKLQKPKKTFFKEKTFSNCPSIGKQEKRNRKNQISEK